MRSISVNQQPLASGAAAHRASDTRAGQALEHASHLLGRIRLIGVEPPRQQRRQGTGRELDRDVDRHLGLQPAIADRVSRMGAPAGLQLTLFTELATDV
jgi:hypothetical protein